MLGRYDAERALKPPFWRSFLGVIFLGHVLHRNISVGGYLEQALQKFVPEKVTTK
jgi:hypothetical protein